MTRWTVDAKAAQLKWVGHANDAVEDHLGPLRYLVVVCTDASHTSRAARDGWPVDPQPVGLLNALRHFGWEWWLPSPANKEHNVSTVAHGRDLQELLDDFETLTMTDPVERASEGARLVAERADTQPTKYKFACGLCGDDLTLGDMFGTGWVSAARAAHARRTAEPSMTEHAARQAADRLQRTAAACGALSRWADSGMSWIPLTQLRGRLFPAR